MRRLLVVTSCGCRRSRQALSNDKTVEERASKVCGNNPKKIDAGGQHQIELCLLWQMTQQTYVSFSKNWIESWRRNQCSTLSRSGHPRRSRTSRKPCDCELRSAEADRKLGMWIRPSLFLPISVAKIPFFEKT